MKGIVIFARQLVRRGIRQVKHFHFHYVTRQFDIIFAPSHICLRTATIIIVAVGALFVRISHGVLTGTVLSNHSCFLQK